MPGTASIPSDHSSKDLVTGEKEFLKIHLEVRRKSTDRVIN
jgi:hypothetical protein